VPTFGLTLKKANNNLSHGFPMKEAIWGVPLLLTWVLAGCATFQAQPEEEKKEACCLGCSETTEGEIASLFDRWNASLQTGDPKQVVANYAERSMLLPTMSNKPRLTPAEKEAYFDHFLEQGPVGHIDMRQIEIGCGMALDAGLYTFTFSKTGEQLSGRYSFTYGWNGSEWLILSHHSSVLPK